MIWGALGCAILLYALGAITVFRKAGNSTAPSTDSNQPGASGNPGEKPQRPQALHRSESKHVVPPEANPHLTHQLIKARRSIFPKDYTGELVEDDAVRTMLQAAVWAPNHGKTEPWRSLPTL